jgi:hypothetical protein
MQRWVDTWKLAGPELERMREEDVRHENTIRAFEVFEEIRLTSTPDLPNEESYFRIDMRGWRIRSSGNELANSESADGEIVSAVSTLNGKRFEAIVLRSIVTREGLSHGADLYFDGRIGMTLHQYDDAPADYPIFVARNPTGLWISYLSDGQITTEQSDRWPKETNERYNG